MTLNGPARLKFKSWQGIFLPQLQRRLLPIVDSVGGMGGQTEYRRTCIEPMMKVSKTLAVSTLAKCIFKDNWAAAAENRESQTESWKDF